MACGCYVLRAQNEARDLALRRFFAGEVPIFIKDGHLYPDRRKCVSICGLEVITNRQDDWKRVEKVTGRTFDLNVIGCEACKAVVIQAAEAD